MPAQSGKLLETVHHHAHSKCGIPHCELLQGNVITLANRSKHSNGNNAHNYQANTILRLISNNEIVFDFKPLDWYLQTTGQRLAGANGAAPAADKQAVRFQTVTPAPALRDASVVR